MRRAVGLVFGVPAIIIALVVANLIGQLGVVTTTLGILAIISFAVIAIGWTEDHDVPD